MCDNTSDVGRKKLTAFLKIKGILYAMRLFYLSDTVGRITLNLCIMSFILDKPTPLQTRDLGLFFFVVIFMAHILSS